jgi:hypothetical protein
VSDLLFGGIRQRASLNELSSKPLSGLFVVLLHKLYAFRHTAYTKGGASKDKDAKSYFAGHVWPGVAGIYNEDFDDQRLVVIGQLIVKWLWKLQAEANRV